MTFTKLNQFQRNNSNFINADWIKLFFLLKLLQKYNIKNPYRFKTILQTIESCNRRTYRLEVPLLFLQMLLWFTTQNNNKKYVAGQIIFPIQKEVSSREEDSNTLTYNTRLYIFIGISFSHSLTSPVVYLKDDWMSAVCSLGRKSFLFYESLIIWIRRGRSVRWCVCVCLCGMLLLLQHITLQRSP